MSPFQATTTPRDPNAKRPKRASSTVERRRTLSMADAKPSVNPKQLQALLQAGMSESEASTAISEVPVRHVSLREPARRSTNEQATSSGRRRETAEDVEAVSGVRRTTSTAAAYKPGDAAARRKIQNRRSLPTGPEPQGKLIGIPHGWRATYEREDIFPSNLDLDALSSAAIDPSAAWPATATDIHTARPPLKPQDRPNWTQQSQCGNSTPHLLLNLRTRHHKKTAPATEPVVPDAGNVQKGLRPPMDQRRSYSAGMEDLVAGAVERIRKEEKEAKARRRRSVLGIFRRG
ncbi:hypothetical protein LTR62_007936 [Meristemomyces frigidus]|uniref:Uncharacterized protein n=1 Tax=Meristemomyces frigidus TaxID=1508187 RepID=A0AAN7TN30_9PEZI|nr:hypothetical protein LTR62_007936 [Meristemomyces frigidus]